MLTIDMTGESASEKSENYIELDSIEVPNNGENNSNPSRVKESYNVPEIIKLQT